MIEYVDTGLLGRYKKRFEKIIYWCSFVVFSWNTKQYPLLV